VLILKKISRKNHKIKGRRIDIMLWSDLERFGSLWDPWREFERMSRALSRFEGTSVSKFPAFNMWVSEDNAVITTEIPGVDPQEIDISVVGKSLTLRGSRKPEEVKEGESYHRRERWYGQFTKTLDLPFKVNTDKVNARFNKGELIIELARAEAEKPRKIAIKSG
jgi:HSP20 family protein